MAPHTQNMSSTFQQYLNEYLGVVAATACTVAFSSGKLLAHDIGNSAPLFTLIAIISSAGGVCVAILLNLKASKFKISATSLKVYAIVAMYGLFESNGSIVVVVLILHLGAANAISIFFSEVIFVTVFSAPFFSVARLMCWIAASRFHLWHLLS